MGGHFTRYEASREKREENERVYRCTGWSCRCRKGCMWTISIITDWIIAKRTFGLQRGIKTSTTAGAAGIRSTLNIKGYGGVRTVKNGPLSYAITIKGCSWVISMMKSRRQRRMTGRHVNIRANMPKSILRASNALLETPTVISTSDKSE